jgi:hypothetical protein
VAVLSSFRSAAAAARFAQRVLADNGQLRQVWRFVLMQLLDDYASVLRHDGVEAASGMWTLEPPSTGSSQVDAALAAMAEYLARRDGWPAPSWVRDPRREASPWWFVTELRGLHPRALVESPASFRRRGVFITADALERV